MMNAEKFSRLVERRRRCLATPDAASEDASMGAAAVAATCAEVSADTKDPEAA